VSGAAAANKDEREQEHKGERSAHDSSIDRGDKEFLPLPERERAETPAGCGRFADGSIFS
jgi:hypothetical protein